MFDQTAEFFTCKLVENAAKVMPQYRQIWFNLSTCTQCNRKHPNCVFSFKCCML